jgi:hypothetical protein
MIELVSGTAGAVRPARAHVVEVGVSVNPGGVVPARAHVLLVGSVRAGSTVTVAWDRIERRPDRMALVLGAGDLSTLPGPATLVGVVVVVTASAEAAAAAAASARTAGARDVVQREAAEGIWPWMLRTRAQGPPEVVALYSPEVGARAAAAEGSLLEGCALLGTTPVAALRVASKGADRAHADLRPLRDHCPVSVTVAVPASDDPVERAALWDGLRAGRLEERHQLVEVDPGAQRAAALRGPADRGAAAAGILAGRIAVRTRAWRAT